MSKSKKSKEPEYDFTDELAMLDKINAFVDLNDDFPIHTNSTEYGCQPYRALEFEDAVKIFQLLKEIK